MVLDSADECYEGVRLIDGLGNDVVMPVSSKSGLVISEPSTHLNCSHCGPLALVLLPHTPFARG